MTAAPTTVDAIRELSVAVDIGSRGSGGVDGRIVGAIALAWSLFQLWIASPLPYALNLLILNDSQARLLHLAFALLLAFAVYPARHGGGARIPAADWLLAAAGVAAALFGFVFYAALNARSGQPILLDVAVSAAGILLLLEATRRAMGPFLVAVAAGFVAYSFAGPYMPEVLQHRGASFTRVMEHQWLATEGIFGVPLGVSASFVFVYVLFGTLLNKAGAGSYIMQLSLAFLGHLRGGPAKVAVVSSGLTGLISGSAIANVVGTGVFTIPLMKRTGISGVKAGAIETAASINGQIMPPVMGAAAFIMVEYVGLPYADIVRHAFLPAIISYLSLVYIVHIEAVRAGTAVLPSGTVRSWRARALRAGLGLSGSAVVLGATWYAVLAVQAAFGAAAPWALAGLMAAAYLAAATLAARGPDLPEDDPDRPIAALPEGWEVARTGLHLLIPIVVLVWCLMIEHMSPGLAAFWASTAAMAIILTQRAVKRLLRGQGGAAAALAAGGRDLLDGLVLGARNMIGVALACATAGIVVGTVTLTGLGLMMTDAVGLLSGGNIYLVLILTALITLILGCGVPTTANYVLVATLMAPVIVELGSEAGLAIPLIAVHLFVFYFGIMADSTPPVGLGAYAAAAISGESPMATCVQASLYSLRTGILAFVMVFNPELLLIGIADFWHGLLVVLASTAGCLVFAAATLNHWLVRSRWWESAALLLVAVSLIYPAAWFDLAYGRHQALPAAALAAQVEAAPAGGRLAVRLAGLTLEGDRTERTVSLRLGPQGPAAVRLTASGLTMSRLDGDPVVAQVAFGSYAARLRLEPGFRVAAVLVPADRPSTLIVYLAAAALLGLVAAAQLRRRPK